jgi:hypothetical protein
VTPELNVARTLGWTERCAWEADCEYRDAMATLKNPGTYSRYRADYMADYAARYAGQTRGKAFALAELLESMVSP